MNYFLDRYTNWRRAKRNGHCSQRGQQTRILSDSISSRSLTMRTRIGRISSSFCHQPRPFFKSTYTLYIFKKQFTNNRPLIYSHPVCYLLYQTHFILFVLVWKSNVFISPPSLSKHQLLLRLVTSRQFLYLIFSHSHYLLPFWLIDIFKSHI